jgi:hypothetical protein
MTVWTPVTLRYLLVSVTLLLFMAAFWPAASATGQPLFEGDLACPAGSPSGDTVAQGLLSALTNPLNSAWAKEAPLTIDPYPNYPEGQPPVTLELDNIPIDCNQDLDNWCFFEHGADHCSSAHANVKLNTLKGLKSLQFNNLTVTDVNLKNVAAHSNRGPDASKITDGVFAPEGADWNDPYYTVVLGWEGAGRALTINLGEATTIDGTQITVQADRHAFQLEYYDDVTKQWISPGTVPELKNVTGLHTRNVACPTTSTSCPTFTTRLVRLWALHPSDNDYNFSISEVQLRDSTSQIISIGKPARGPRPYQITDGVLAQPGTSSTNPQYAVVLTHETGPAPALVIDLEAVMTICGNGWDCLSEPTIQADNDDVYQLDYSIDGQNWITYGQFPTTPNSGLQTRTFECNTRPDLTQPCSATNHGPNFTARYVRVYAVSGGATFSVSELQLWDISSNLVSVGASTYGPEPLATNEDFAPDQQTDWNDSRYATILPPCSTSASNAKSICPPPSSPPTSPALTAALLIDLTASFPVDHLVIQADRHQFQVDSSTDGVSWTPLWTVPAVSGSGLITRTSPSLGGHQARYLRVYGTAGSDNNYSVSELQVFTPQANTACAYDGGANPGENFACSYDGQFSPGIVLPNDSNTTLPLAFYLESAEIRVTCDYLVYHDTFTLSSATNRNCTPTLELASPPPAADFCAGSCSTRESILSYAQIPDEKLEFVTTSLNCNPSAFDDGIEALLEGVVAGVAAEAVQGLYNGILNYHNKPNSLVPFPPNPGMCPATVSEPPPPTPSPDNISGLWGRAVQVGSTTNNASLRLMGRFMVEEPLALDQAVLTLDALLREIGGAGELVQGPAGSLLVPLSLQPLKGSKPDRGIYRTPPGAWPIVHAQVTPVKGFGAQSDLMEFIIDVERATIHNPAGCAGGPPPTAPLTTSFRLVGGSEAPVWVRTTADWQCNRTMKWLTYEKFGLKVPIPRQTGNVIGPR